MLINFNHFFTYCTQKYTFQTIFQNTTTLKNLWNSDIDECSEGLHDCHDDATCVDTFGDYECICKPGFHGDGTNKCLGENFNYYFNKSLVL